ncbi:MAG: phage tail protein [Butyricicoccus sp.]|nr:phage tail protein [Butyricicoccus sp.]
MIKFREGLITDILPSHLSKQIETQALAFALHRQIDKLCDFADNAAIYTAIETVPEEILDYLAIELRTPCYDMNYAVEVKRELILSTLPYYAKMGTTHMVNSILTTIFGKGYIKEFFECGLEPHHFAVRIVGAEATTRPIREIVDVLDQVKRKSQWLDRIELEFDTMSCTQYLGCAMTMITSTPVPMEPDVFDFRKELHLGGAVGSITSMPVPQERDALDLRMTLNMGGRMGTIMRTPLPEIKEV